MSGSSHGFNAVICQRTVPEYGQYTVNFCLRRENELGLAKATGPKYCAFQEDNEVQLCIRRLILCLW